jgi:diadenylate cyclase
MLINIIPANTEWWKILIDAYIIWVLLFFVFKFIASNKRMLNVTFAYLFIYILKIVAEKLSLVASVEVLQYLVEWLPVVLIVILAPDIRRSLEMIWKAEKHNTLDQYSERAIVMNSDVSKELLINIFTPLTPLHDGAVIIRGDKIICAGAYFVLSENQNFDKTMGSRHRAGLGISEVSDSLTVIVSEETGHISIAVEGILLKINDRDKLLEYVNMFLK